MSGDKINTQAFEAGSGEMEGEVEPVFINRRSTRAVAIKLRVHHMGRTLLGTYEIIDRDLSDADVEQLFRECYLQQFTDRYYADKVDKIELTTADGTVKFRFEHP